jgi:hypothetical protein
VIHLGRRIFFLAALCCSNVLHPTITHMAEFHNPETKQTIIWAGDTHYILPEVDAKQCDDLVQAITLLRAPLISETDAQATIKEPSTSFMVLDTLPEGLKKQQIPVHGIEFRENYGDLMYLLFHKYHLFKKDHDNLLKIGDDPQAASKIHGLLYEAWAESYAVFENMIPYAQSIPKKENYTEKDRAYYDVFDDLLGKYDKYKAHFIKVHKEHNQKPVNEQIQLFLKDTFIKREDESVGYRKNSFLLLTRDAANTMLDAVVLKKLHELKDEPVVFVHTGDFHLDDFESTHLKHLGFELKHQVTMSSEHCRPFFEGRCKNQEKLSEKEWALSEERKKLLASIDYQSCGVDVKKFLDGCKNLKQKS